MDTSPEYMKQCEKAWPYLKDHFPIFSRRLCMLYVLDGKAVFWRDDVNTGNCDRAYPLWEQDQLQEMLETKDTLLYTSAYGKLACLNTWLQKQVGSYFGVTGSPLGPHPSAEQIWLAYVMFKRFNESWTGEDWKVASE